jgi:hypothetical protein
VSWRSRTQITQFGMATWSRPSNQPDTQNGGYRAWPTELRFTLSSCSAGLRGNLCSWPGVVIGSWP